MALCIKYLLITMRFRVRIFISHTNTSWAWGPACNSSSWKAKPGNLQSKLVSYPGGSYVRAQGSSERRCLDEEGGQQPRKTAGFKPWASTCIHTCAHASTPVLMSHTHTYRRKAFQIPQRMGIRLRSLAFGLGLSYEMTSNQLKTGASCSLFRSQQQSISMSVLQTCRLSTEVPSWGFVS